MKLLLLLLSLGLLVVGCQSSSNGVPGSAASAITRSLKSSQESSRFRSRGGGPSAGSTRDDTPFSVVQQGKDR